MFDEVIKAEPKEFAAAAPDVGMQYEARYFRAVTELLAGKADAAMTALQELEAWQSANLPNPAAVSDPDAKARAQSAKEGASAAASMLRYRILSQQAEQATSAENKQKRNDEAAATLMQLLREQPSLQGIVYEQLAGKLSDAAGSASLASLDAVLLQALVRRGENEVHRSDSGPVDSKTLDRAIAAARELSSRKGVDPHTADSAALLIGFFLDRLDRDTDATAAFLDCVQKNPRSKNATIALDNAQWLLGQLRRNRQDDRMIPRLWRCTSVFCPSRLASRSSASSSSTNTRGDCSSRASRRKRSSTLI
jgi:hypothetical protein